MKGKKGLIVFFVIAALLIAALIIITSLGREEAPDDSSDVILSLGTLESLAYTNNGEWIELENDGSGWYLGGDDNLPIQQSTMSSLVTFIKTVRAVRFVDDSGENLALYGLDEPKISIAATADGKTHKIYIGNQVKEYSDYYCMLENGSVYTVSRLFAEAFSTSLYDLLQPEKIPSVSTDSTERVYYDNGASEFSLVRTMAGDADYSGAGQWFFGEELIECDMNAVKELFNDIYRLGYAYCADYQTAYAEAGTLPEGFGFSDAVRLRFEWRETAQDDTGAEQIFERSFELYIGESVEKNGITYYYSHTDGSPYVNLIVYSLAEPLLELKAEDFMTPYCAKVKSDTVERAVFTAGDKSVTLEIDRSNMYIVYRVNGEEYSEADFNDLLSQITSLKCDSRLYAGEEENGELVAEITFYRNTPTHSVYTAKIYTYNVNFYRCEVNGRSWQLISARDMEKLLDRMEESAR